MGGEEGKKGGTGGGSMILPVFFLAIFEPFALIVPRTPVPTPLEVQRFFFPCLILPSVPTRCFLYATHVICTAVRLCLLGLTGMSYSGRRFSSCHHPLSWARPQHPPLTTRRRRQPYPTEKTTGTRPAPGRAAYQALQTLQRATNSRVPQQRG